jgi:putative tricarboxylic transport membrane protein
MKEYTMKKGLVLACSVFFAFFTAEIALAAGGTDAYPAKSFEFIAPAGAGGGFDTTIRMVAKTLGEEKIINQPMPVVNKVGGGGAVALSYMQQKKGNNYEIVVFSPPLLLINLTGQTNLGFKDLTPIAKLIEDYGAFAVPKNSKYQTILDVMADLKKDPKSVKIGGGSSAGSMDHIQFLAAARAAGVSNIRDIPYISMPEGSLAALMGGHIDLLSTGMAETVGAFESGDIRVLALTCPTRVQSGPLAQVPTLIEAGINTSFINWRGLFGAPGMGDNERAYMADALQKMSQTAAWKDICTRNGWAPAYMGSADFEQYLAQTNENYRVILQAIGMLK